MTGNKCVQVDFLCLMCVLICRLFNRYRCHCIKLSISSSATWLKS